MINQSQEPQYRNNSLSVLVGLLVGSVAGAITMLLLAPQSGKETRKQIQEKGTQLRDRTFEVVEDTVGQLRSKTNELTTSGREKIDELKTSGREKFNELTSTGREKFKELKQQGQELAVEQLDRVAEAAEAGKKAIQKS